MNIQNNIQITIRRVKPIYSNLLKSERVFK